MYMYVYMYIVGCCICTCTMYIVGCTCPCVSWKKTRAKELLTVETKLDTATGFEENWTLEEASTSILNDVCA
jgi:hypothetical protein